MSVIEEYRAHPGFPRSYPVVQLPNTAFWSYLVLTVAAVVAGDDVHDSIVWMARGALAVWAADEIVAGVNLFRRVLGAAVLTTIVVRLLS